MDFELNRQHLDALAAYYSTHQAQRNEASTRLHLIDRLFFECLGWDRDDCVAEESHAGTYADYTFRTTRRVLIVEAKKEGDYFELPVGEQRLTYSLAALSRDYPNLRAAIDQASGYCQERGVPFGCVCDGHQIVAFLATRSDGISPMEGAAIVFPSFEQMLSKFLDLWNALSKPGISSGQMERQLLGHKATPLPPKLSSTIPLYPGIKGRNPFQVDLKIVSDLVLEDLAKSRDLEERFLRECYCHSGALSQHALISKEILRTRYSALFGKDVSGPTLVPAQTKHGLSPEVVSESLSRRPILLVGDVGVGKTTFIRHLLKVESGEVFNDVLALYLDLGARAALTRELKEYILDELTRQLLDDHGVDIYENSFVLGVYNQELSRFAKGIYAQLRDLNPAKYEEKRIEYIEGLVAKRDLHLRSSIIHLSRARTKQVVVFLDNADQRTDAVQQDVFIIAQELAETWTAAVFVALRPETFHKSLKSGSLSGYHPKAFTISPPRIDRVVNKRLIFGLKLARGDIPISGLPERTKVNLGSLASIMKAFADSLDRNTDLIEAIDNLSGGNVRRALDFVRDFFGSGHVNTKKIESIYSTSGSYDVPLHEFLRAVVYGDGIYYDPSRSPIANVFDVSTNQPNDHFLVPIALGAVGTVPGHGPAGFVETARIYDALQNSAFTPVQIDAALSRAYAKGLFETASRVDAVSDGHVAVAVRISTIGAYHLQRLISQFVYVDAIVTDTPILIAEYRNRMPDAANILDRIDRAGTFVAYLDEQWQKAGLSTDLFNWPAVSVSLKRDCERVRERTKERDDRRRFRSDLA